MAVEPADLVRELVRRGTAQRAADQGRAREVRRLVAAEVAAILEDRWAYRAWLIGSLAWGTFGVRSDVDILRIEDLPESFRQRIVAEGIELAA